MVMWIYVCGGLDNLMCKTSNCFKPTIVCKYGLGADQLIHHWDCA